MNSENIVSKYFEDKGLTVEKIPETDKKTPDFEISKNGSKALCEVKETNNSILKELSERLENAKEGEIVEVCKSDPTFNKIARHIEKAVDQFNQYDSACTIPRILFIVNNDPSLNMHDLISTITGNFYADDGKVYPMNKNVSEGKIREAKLSIDLYILHNSEDKKTSTFWIKDRKNNLKIICDLLGEDFNKIMSLEELKM